MRLLIAVLVLIAGSLPSLGEEPDSLAPALAALFPPGKDICYAAKLPRSAAKPSQTLAEMYLYRLYDPQLALEDVSLTHAEASAFDVRMNTTTSLLDVVARFNDAPHIYSQSLSCLAYENGAQVMCGVDCDGGSFHVKAGDGRLDALFPDDGRGLSLNQSCGDPDEEGLERWLTAKETGGDVALARAPVADCLAARDSARPAFAADPMSIRERIATSGWRCLKRAYDEAHLKSHPEQQVAAIAVAIAGPVEVEKSEDGFVETTLRTTLSFKLRDGEVHVRPLACSADQYQFRCDDGLRLRRRDGASAWALAGAYDAAGSDEVRILDVPVGSDDKLFRLDASGDVNCSLE